MLPAHKGRVFFYGYNVIKCLYIPRFLSNQLYLILTIVWYDLQVIQKEKQMKAIALAALALVPALATPALAGPTMLSPNMDPKGTDEDYKKASIKVA